MRLFEYIYYLTYKWMLRQGRNRPQDNARGILILAFVMYASALVAFLDDFLGTGIFHLVSGFWPLQTSAKYFKPLHALAFLIGIACISFVVIYFREKRFAYIFERFKSSQEGDSKSGPVIVMAFFFGAICLGVAASFRIYMLFNIVLAAHIAGATAVYYLYRDRKVRK